MKQVVSPFAPNISALNLVIFYVLFGLTFVFIVTKALTIPITHDEVATALYYPNLSNYDLVTLANGDQNNHILNSLLSKWSISIFGKHLWALRLPSILSFIVYCFAAKNILSILIGTKSKSYSIGTLFFVLSPYVIDFFCLSRGYGMSLAFVTWSVACLLHYSTSQKIDSTTHPKSIYLFQSVIFASLGCFSNFSSISFLCAIIAFVFIYFLFEKRQRRKNLLLLGLLLLFIASLMYLPLLRISEADQFIGWHNNGFIQDTFMSIVRLSLYGSKIFLTTIFISYFFIIILCIGFLHFLSQWQKSKTWVDFTNRQYLIAISCLFLTVLINVIQGWVLQLPNLNGRIALFFYPLIVIGLLACKPLFNFIYSKIKYVLMILIAVLGIHHIVHISRVDQVLEWSYDAHTLKVLNEVVKSSNNQEVRLETNWLFQPSLSFHGMENKFHRIEIGNYSKEINQNSTADFYYCKAEDYEYLSQNFNVFIKFDDNWLLKRK